MSTNRKSPHASGEASGRVVVGVHGSRSSLRALRYAAEIALDRGWDLEIVTAWPDADDPLIHDVPGRYIDGARTRGRVPTAGPRDTRPGAGGWCRHVPGQRAIPRRRSSPDAMTQTCWWWARDSQSGRWVGAASQPSASTPHRAPCRSCQTRTPTLSWTPGRRSCRRIGAAADGVARRPRSVTGDGQTSPPPTG